MRAAFDWGEGAFDFCLMRVSTILLEIGIPDLTAASISRASASEDALEHGSDSSPRLASTCSTVGDTWKARD